MIDVLRATSTIVTAIAAGASGVVPVDTPEEALAVRAADPTVLLAGERGAHPLPGFDRGNSPAGMLDLGVRGRRVVLATTNGSRALAWAVAHGTGVVALALLNVAAVAAAITAGASQDVLVLCAGTEGRFSLDDAYVAGALLDALPGSAELGENARAALWAYRGAPPGAFGALTATAPGRSLIKKGYRADVEFCARRDAFDVVPRWRDGALR